MYQGSSEFRRRQELQVKQNLKPPKRRRRTSQVKKLGPPPQPVTACPVIKQEPQDDDITNVASCSKAPSSQLCMTSQGHGLLAAPATSPPAPALDPMLKELLKAEDDLMNQEGLMQCCREVFEEESEDLFAAACHLMDHQLYTFVKWARTLPLYKELKVGNFSLLVQCS